MTREEGIGAPLLFLHALGASSRYWHGRLGTLPRKYHCILPDLLGFGRSPKPEGAYTIDDHLAALSATLSRLGVRDQPIVLIGHSLGAILAVEYAARFPELVSGLVLISLPLYQSKEEAEAFIIEHGQWMARMTVRNGGIAHLIHRFVAPFRPLLPLLVRHLATGMPPEVAEDALAHTWASYSRTLEHCILSHDLRPALSRLPLLPILVFHGDADPSAPLPAVQTLAERMPEMTLHVLPGGHHVFLENQVACLTAIVRYCEARDSRPPGT